MLPGPGSLLITEPFAHSTRTIGSANQLINPMNLIDTINQATNQPLLITLAALTSTMFVLLKILLYLFRPLIWILILFIIAILTRNQSRRRWLFTIAVTALLFFTNPFVIRSCIGLYETKEVPMSQVWKYNAGILLGGMVSYNKHDDKGYFNPAADRFIETALLFKTGRINNIIVAAGNGYITKNNFREALFVKQHLVELGIPAEQIFTDTSSRNTLENAQFSKKIIDSFHIPGPYLLISSAMHLPRAQRVFKKAGVTTDLFPCDFVAKRISNNFFEDYLLPSSYALPEWDSWIKEIVGTLTYKITGKG
jgi:uncharacterized SAM-binding protein YcdF (DUF218 family)